MIYFDNASTTYPKPKEIYDELGTALKVYGFNASRGSYKEALKTKNLIEKTKKIVASKANAHFNNVIFTKSATESINIILNTILSSKDTVFVSHFEHNSVIRTLKHLNVKVILLPTMNNYDFNIPKINDLFLIHKPKLIILSHVSNVTGYVLDYENIFSIAKKYNILTLLDAAQSFCELEINNSKLDFLVFSGHKTPHSICGVGGIVNYNNYPLKPLIYGGTGTDSLNLDMPEDFDKFYAGTQDIIAIYSLKRGIELTSNIKNNKYLLTKYLLSKLKDLDDIIIYNKENYLPYGIVSFNIKGFSASDVSFLLEEKAHILVRSGYHCAAYLADVLDYKKYNGTVRVSLGLFNTNEEIDILIDTLEDIIYE